MVFGEGIVDGRGGIFLCGEVGLVFFSGKRKLENRGGEGPVILILF